MRKTPPPPAGHILAFPALLAFLAAGLCLSGCYQAPPSPGGRATPVRVVPVHQRAVDVRLRAVGELRAIELTPISAETPGLIQAIRFEEAQTVQKGQTLVELDPSEAQAQLESAEATLQRRRIELRRLEELMDEDAATEREIDDARAAVKRAEADVALGKARLANHTIKAPFNGITGRVQTDVGAYLQPGRAVTNLTRLDPIEAHFPIPGPDLARVEPGQQVELELPNRDDPILGEVSFVNPEVDPQSRTGLVVARIPNADNFLRPGRFVDVSVVVDQRPDAVVIPEHAVSLRADQPFTYVVESGQAKRRDLTLGQRFAGLVEIREGLSAGEFVVSSDHGRISDGVPVAPSPDRMTQKLGIDYPAPPETLPEKITGQRGSGRS